MERPKTINPREVISSGVRECIGGLSEGTVAPLML